MVYGLDRVMSFSGRWLVLDGVAQRTRIWLMIFCCMMHSAWVTATITVVLRALMHCFFCMISSISKGGVKYRTRM